jgi:hypothetical protein
MMIRQSTHNGQEMHNRERDNVAHRRWDSCGGVMWRKHPDVEEIGGGEDARARSRLHAQGAQRL